MEYEQKINVTLIIWLGDDCYILLVHCYFERKGQGNGKGAATAGMALYIDGAAVAFDDFV